MAGAVRRYGNPDRTPGHSRSSKPNAPCVRRYGLRCFESDLARYVSPDVADALAGSVVSRSFGRPAKPPGRRALCRHRRLHRPEQSASTPERTFALLRRAFRSEAPALLFSHRGTLDKFLGDGLMATFGALSGRRRRSPARASRVRIRAFGQRWSGGTGKRQRSGGEHALPVSIGVHCGPVFVGNLGWGTADRIHRGRGRRQCREPSRTGDARTRLRDRDLERLF